MSEEPKKGGFLLHVVPYIVMTATFLNSVLPEDSTNPYIRTVKIISKVLCLSTGHETPVLQLDNTKRGECKYE